MTSQTLLITHPLPNYELIDSGEGEKLERYGDKIICRPDPQALWKKQKKHLWENADAVFERHKKDPQWKSKFNIQEEWITDFGILKLITKLSPFKHTGIFPEQYQNWIWIQEKIKKENRTIKVLNIFGYTGAASMIASASGAEVCHIDGSKSAIAWAKRNAEVNGISNIRWIFDDAQDFVKREIKRGKRYDGIIMDPPAFGHGPKKQLWKIEEHFIPFFDQIKEVLSDTPLFVLINGYASGYSSIAYENNLKEIQKKMGGSIEYGELAIQESKSNRLLPSGIFARWTK